jgi:chaperonin GroES
MNLKPIGTHIILKPVDAETKTASGIIIPETAAKERSERGIVVAVGPGAMLENGQRRVMEVVVGQTVLYKSWEEPIEIDGAKFLVITQDDIKAIIE